MNTMTHCTENDIENVSVVKKSKEYTIDEVLENRGLFTPRQLFIQLALVLLCLFISYNNVFSYFTGASPSWTCTSPHANRFCQLNFNRTITSDMKSYKERCNMNHTDWRYTSSRDYSFVTEYDLICGKTNLAAFVSASYYIGGVLGCLLSGSAADRFGRKPILLISSIITTIASIACMFVSSILQLIILNVIRGASTYPSFMCCMLYQSELAPPSLRPILMNMLQFSFSCSLLYIDLLSYSVQYNWRHLTLYATLPCIPVIIILWFIPESPRWLLVNERKTQAEKTVSRLIGEETSKVSLKYDTSLYQEKYKFKHLFNTFAVFKLTLSAAVLWFAVPVVYYSIALQSSNLGGSMYQAFALSTIADLFANIPAAYLCNRIGRKKTVLGSLFVSGILLVCIILVPSTYNYRYTVNMIIAMIAKLACNIGASSGFIWVNEVFPTVMRSRGFFICALSDRLGLISVPFITRSLKYIASFLPFVVICMIAVIGSIVGLILPETLNQPTNERFEDFLDQISKRQENANRIENQGYEDNNI